MARLAVDAWIAPLSLLPISCRIGRPCRLRYRCRIPGATFPTGCSQWQAEAEKHSSRLPTPWSTDWPGGRSPQGMEQSLHALRGRRWIATDRRMISTPPSSSDRFKPIRHPAPRLGSASCLTGRRGRASFGNTSFPESISNGGSTKRTDLIIERSSRRWIGFQSSTARPCYSIAIRCRIGAARLNWSLATAMAAARHNGYRRKPPGLRGRRVGLWPSTILMPAASSSSGMASPTKAVTRCSWRFAAQLIWTARDRHPVPVSTGRRG